MRHRTIGVAGIAVATAVGGLVLGFEAPRPSLSVQAHSAASRSAVQTLINDPRKAALLSESAQVILQPLKVGSSSSPSGHHAAAATTTGTTSSWITPNPPLAFNNDHNGLPQNEESVSNCAGGHKILGAWNDFRGYVSGGDLTGWGISTNGGTSLRNSGFLPGATVNAPASGPASGPYGGPGPSPPGGSGGSRAYVATAGDPVIRATPSCDVYASSLGFSTNPDETFISGIVIDRSNASTLASCKSQQSCWPLRKVIAKSNGFNGFTDKPWMAVDNTGPTPHVWIGYTEYNFNYDYGFEVDSLNVVECSASLACSRPITLEADYNGFFYGGFSTPTFADIAVGSGGRIYVSWATVSYDNSTGYGTPTMFVRLTSAAPGSKKFATPTTVTSVTNTVFNLNSETVRLNAFPALAVSHVGGVDHIALVYGRCRAVASVFGPINETICEHSEVVVATSPTGQPGSWRFHSVDAAAGDDFFPTATVDATAGQLLVGYWTTRFDPAQHRYDIVVAPVNPATGVAAPLIRITSRSIEPDVDPFLSVPFFGPGFIGDYWELTASGGTAWAHYTTTQRLQRLEGQGVPVPQQDNALSTFTY